MIIHKDSHLDHSLTQEQIDHIVKLFADKKEFFIETIELPEWLGEVDCALYGPVMGDKSIGPGLVDYQKRGSREYASRMVDMPMRKSRKVTVIAGPHDGHDCVLFTAFGGPLAPKEVGDPTLTSAERQRSEAFWSEHALAQ